MIYDFYAVLYPNYKSKCSKFEGSIGEKCSLLNIQSGTVKANVVILERMHQEQIRSRIGVIDNFALS